MMFAVPILLVILLFTGIALLSMGEVYVRQESPPPRGIDQFYLSIQKTEEIAAHFNENGNREQLLQEATAFNSVTPPSHYLSIFYKGSALLLADDTPPPSLVEQALAIEGSHLLVVGPNALYTLSTGDYQLLMTDTQFPTLPATYINQQSNRVWIFSLGLLTLLILIIVVTNLVLTRMVSKSILGPLGQLVDGVHQLRDGNLGYRIAYGGNDEFASICDDFNEMAGHLQEMVNARLIDNENRKELVAGISHDLRTPLTSIKAYVEGLETGVASTPEVQQRYLATIRQKTDDLEHIVSQLFTFSSLDIGDFPLQMEPLHLWQELNRYLLSVGDEYRLKGLTLQLEGKPDDDAPPLLVVADPVQLRNIFTNVLENSLKYAGRQDINVVISVSTCPGHAVICLRDNGPGVPEGALPRLTDVFYRVDTARGNPRSGSGLGLAITSKMVERFGGRLAAENAPDGGLAIIITLPTKDVP